MIVSRRSFLKYIAVNLSVFSSKGIAKVPLITQPRVLVLNNINTRERIESRYFDGLDYVPSELRLLDLICRDYRNNEIFSMDVRLFDQIKYIQYLIKHDSEVNIISAYRSPMTNNMLRNNSTGVAEKSFHMLGQALDFSLTGVSLEQVHKAALSMKAGGVGYYPRSGFVHIDTGPVRQWQGR